MNYQGDTIDPTNKSFKILIANVAEIVDDLIDVEYYFWDNQELFAQIGFCPNLCGAK